MADPIIPVKALTRIGSVNPGELCGFPEPFALALIERGLAVHATRAEGASMTTQPMDTLVTRDVDAGTPTVRKARRKKKAESDDAIVAVEEDEREEAEDFNASLGLPPDED